MPLALLSEQGIVGFGVFASLLAARAWTIVSPSADRRLWAALPVTLRLFGMSGDARSEKITWVPFGLPAAQKG